MKGDQNPMVTKLKRAKSFMLRNLNPKRAVAGAYLAMSSLCMGVFAITVNTTDVSANKLVNNLVGTILDIFRWIGVLLLVWAVGQVIMAFKNEDADSKSRAMMMAVVSILLITLKSVLQTIGIIT